MEARNITAVLRSSASVSTGIMLLLAVYGCNKPMAESTSRTKGNPSNPATKIENEPVAELAAFTMLPPSVITVDSREITFPGAKLAVISHGTGGITLRVCSDDPPAAIDPGYLGNSYLFDMQLAIDQISELPLARWDRKASDSGDSTSGIFMHGYRNPLRPADMHVSFEKNGVEVLTYITGTFLQDDDQNPGAPPRRVPVNACLHTTTPTE